MSGRKGHTMPEGADFETWVAGLGLSVNDVGELGKFRQYLGLEAAKREHGDPTGLCTTLQTLIYAKPTDDTVPR